ncbi:cellulose synthase (UDP-forming), glycosyl transferase family 2 [Gordonia amicalis]|uniref:cellulose synthase (UDP-forming), glycosyl transferase family 2 n=1 Tax=Gordonia amicalis TaxID=89053 RepID=UPI0022A7FB98|nr:cellulose synthase (UDP-forming), glycosyl transferase family 2 [Gordonia amicalis]MCZ0911877.1 cellulose synthase (UDP-forming), glycosyl transferase family 2 [Gordonia amicalis]MDV7173454.1 cellulose synthase (UDP-forming), glycosyl transferase family 2 [Gordonia amicalis]
MTAFGPEPDDARPVAHRERPNPTNWNRISVWEVVGYTLAILFIAALALGWFDIMLPWDSK